MGTIKDNDAASAATASARSSADALEDALAAAEGLTPDEAADALFGERQLSEARLAALDLLGNRNGRYDLGDLLSWIERCRRGEARCGPTSTGSGPPSAAGLLAAAAAGRPWISRRTRRRGSGRPGRKPIRAARRRGRFAGYALATLLAVTMTMSCSEGSVGPAANVQDPGFLTVEWTGPAAGRGIGVLLELEGPGIEAVRAPGFELYESRASGRHEIVVAGSLRAGPLVQFRVPDRGQLPLYRGPRPRGRGRGLRAQGRRGVPGRDHAALTTPAKMGPPTCAARFECVWGATPTAAGARAGVARPGLLRAAPSSACLTGRMAPGWPVEPAAHSMTRAARPHTASSSAPGIDPLT